MCFANPAAVNVDRNRTLQQANREYEPQSRLDSEKDSAQTAQRPILKANDLPGLQVRPGNHRDATLPNVLDRGNLLLVDREHCLTDSGDVEHARRHQNWDPIIRIHPAEEIFWKQGHCSVPRPVRPLARELDQRQVALVTGVLQEQSSVLFSARSGPDGVPGPLMISGTHSNFHKTSYRHKSLSLVEPLYRYAPRNAFC
jgi:hypothetical protein